MAMERLSFILRQSGNNKDREVADGIDSWRRFLGRDIPVLELLESEVPNRAFIGKIDYTTAEKTYLYIKVAKGIYSDIRTGRYRRKVPPQVDLIKKYRVSMGTIREAIKLLEQHGIVIKRQGLGTFVRRENIAGDDVITVYPQERKGLTPKRRGLPPPRGQ